MSLILDKYNQDVNNKKIVSDSTQLQAIHILENIAHELKQPLEVEEVSFLSKIFSKKEQIIEPVKGLYMWGGVGRGKTYLMDLFYHSLDIKEKQRIHFHRFMQQIHAKLKALKNTENPLVKIADDYSSQYRLLCLDEFNVTDITDAMLLSGLLTQLFNNGVTLVTTSNTVPDNLYKDGLQRERFLPAIELLKKHTVVFNLDTGTDYRLRTLTQAKTWWVNEAEKANKYFDSVFNQLTICEIKTEPLQILQREINVIKRGQGVAWFEFKKLCDGPRSVADYIEMSRLFHTIFISSVPKLSAQEDNIARRFIEFIDECYDRHVNILVCANVEPEHLYDGKRLAAMFERTKSRLQEMQSQEYLSLEHLG